MPLYQTQDLDIGGEAVIWVTAGGHEVPGTARFTPSGKLVAIVRQQGVGQAELRGLDIPRYWRPQHPERWPAPLPRAVSYILDPVTKDRSILDLGDDVPHEDWPYRGVRHSRAGTVPGSPRDLDGRIRRCIRTARVLEYEPEEIQCVWPPQLMIAAQVIEKQLLTVKSRDRRATLKGFRDGDDDDFYVDTTDARPIVARWQPTPRDVSDYESRPNPISWIPKTYECLFVWRSAMPERSWEMIADALGNRQGPAPIEFVIEDYKKALQLAWDAARRAHG